MAINAGNINEVELKSSLRKETIKSIKKDWQLYSLLILPIIYYIIFKYGPLYGNIIAFRKYVPGGPVYGTEWVGFRYFEMFITDPTFWNVFKNNIILSVGSLIFGFPLPIIFALLLNELSNGLFKRVVQTTSYLPHFLSAVIVAEIIMEMLSPTSGVINMLIKTLGGEPIHFLASPEWFRPIYWISGIWQETGWGAIIYLAALSNISPELYEAAAIDGAGRWQQTVHITIPGIMPTIIILLILNIGGLMGVGFEKILLLYNPLTYSTADVISTYLYRMGLESNNFSYATAIGLFESIIGFTLVTVANYVSRKLTDTSLW
ncbi:MAG: putative aldouronate transport system permease protein [Clostridiales bacterium]|jgi:putative aldouronate transport system permease protein|nr:putative aldouronate transport system permease protein [Clostridiales bacterium]MDK2992133.1 putative aldouronate transport system permease protein [Clostridiales bacterium]